MESYVPRTITTTRGLPKLHAPGIPMRPITSGIGSATHRLAKVLAKPLSTPMGTISSAHLTNLWISSNEYAPWILQERRWPPLM